MQITDLHKIFIQHPIISTDSRTIKKGEIFWALKGDNFDGNQYINAVLESGASYAITDNKKYKNTNQCIFVENSLKTLQDLAAYHRKTLKIPIIAITGTNGKTTTKELVTQVLQEKFKVKSTVGNFNNHIGVPLTLLSFNKTTEIGVVEMGANHPKEIETLCKIAIPDYGIITNIGKAHLEGFGTFEGLINTKAELYSAIESIKGKIFINNDNSLLKGLIKKQETITYGTKANVFCKAELISANPFVRLKLTYSNHIEIESKLIGQYNFENILAAACVGKHFGVSANNIKKAIESYIPKNSRSQIIKKDSLNIILDAYNANPTSMTLAIENFINIKTENKIFILGDMFELGGFAEEEHKSIIQKLIKYKQQYKNLHILLVGSLFHSLHTKLFKNEKIKSFNTTPELINYISEIKFKDSWFLIKGSRGMILENVLNFINSQ